MELVNFLGWNGPGSLYAFFKVAQGEMSKLLVAHEGNWLDERGMSFYPDYELYEDVQKDLGKGLRFIKKEYSKLLKRSIFLYDFEYNNDREYILAVPATGEEIYFEIYGVDRHGALVLLVEREL